MQSEARLVVVRQCVDQLWESRRDGRWSALECALIVVLTPQKASASDPGYHTDRRVKQRRNNVIVLQEYLERRRLADRRTRKPP